MGNFVNFIQTLPATRNRTQPGDRGVFASGNTAPTYNMIDYITITSPSNSTDFGDLAFIANSFPIGISNGAGGRGTFSGAHSNNMEYITISTPSNSQDFGDMLRERWYGGDYGTSNGTNNRGVIMGGYYSSATDAIDYFTITSLSNCQDFGDLNDGIRYAGGQTSNGVNNRGLVVGGYRGVSTLSSIKYITITSLGNSNDFGNLLDHRSNNSVFSNGVNNRGISAFGSKAQVGAINTIEYYSISSLGSTTDFGDTLVSGYSWGSCSNGVGDRGVLAGSSIMYITISSPSNATNFGNLQTNRTNLAGLANA